MSSAFPSQRQASWHVFIANVSRHRPPLHGQVCSLEHEHPLSKETQDSRGCLANGLRGQFFYTQCETRATNSLEIWVLEIFYPENSRGGSKMLSAQISLKSCSSGLANKQVETGDTRKQRRAPEILAVSFVEPPTATAGWPLDCPCGGGSEEGEGDGAC